MASSPLESAPLVREMLLFTEQRDMTAKVFVAQRLCGLLLRRGPRPTMTDIDDSVASSQRTI